MKTINKKLSLVICQLSIAMLPLSALHAQQDSTLNRTVVVENEYNPDIMDASKINVLPKVEEPAVVKQGIEYATALRPVSSWTYENMSPITREWAMPDAKRGYLCVGYGNYSNVDVKAGYVWDMTKQDRLQVKLSFDGWNGTLKDREEEDWKSRFYATDVRLGYAHQFRKVTLDLGGGIGSQVFNYLSVSVPESIDRQHHALGDFHIGLSSSDQSSPIGFSLQTGMQYFGIKHPLDYENDGKENKIHTVGNIWKNLDGGQRFGIGFSMDNLSYSSDTLMSNYTSLGFNPYYVLENDDWRLRFGAHIDWQSGDDSGVDVASDVKVEYLFSESYVLYLHALGGRELNDYRRLNGFSPYWSLRGKVASTYVPVNATLGFKASPTNGLWIHLFGGYRVSNDELSCVLMEKEKVFYYTRFLQADTKTAYGGAELKYGYKDWFDASLKGVFYSWKADHASEDWFLASKPKAEVTFRAEAKIIEGLKVNVGYEYVQRNSYTTDAGDLSLGNISNLNVGACYAIMDNLSVFGRVNNLLNKQYYHEYGYPAEKLNVLAGLSLKF